MRISVVIPAYNAEQTLEETLDSVVGQTCAPDEVIIVDDGSTDQTKDVAARHKLAHQLVRTANCGAAAALNTGVKASTGDVIAFLDADDLWTPRKLELQRAAMEADPSIDLVMGHYEAFECPSVAPEELARLRYAKGLQPGYLMGCMMIKRRRLKDSGVEFDRSLRTGYHIDWMRRLRAVGLNEHMLPDVVMRRRIAGGTLGQRVSNSDGLSNDFLEIARRALAAKRRNSV